MYSVRRNGLIHSATKPMCYRQSQKARDLSDRHNFELFEQTVLPEHGRNMSFFKHLGIPTRRGAQISGATAEGEASIA